MSTLAVVAITVFGFALCIVSGVLTMRVATSKGYKPIGWFFVGAFFWIPALIAVAGITPRLTALANKRYSEMDDYDIEREESEKVPQG